MPETLRALIVDDERRARQSVRSALADQPDVEVVAEASTVDEAADHVRRSAPDVIFLDVQMRTENGFDLLKRVDRPMQVIFVTAYDEYAARAFEVNALDYLLKPIGPDRLTEALNRARASASSLPQQQSSAASNAFRYDDVFLCDEGHRPRFVRIQDIVYIKADGNYTELHLLDGDTVLTLTALHTWEQRLPDAHFARIHRSTIVQIGCVDRMERTPNATYEAHVPTRDTPLAVSRRRGAALKEHLSPPSG